MIQLSPDNYFSFSMLTYFKATQPVASTPGLHQCQDELGVVCQHHLVPEFPNGFLFTYGTLEWVQDSEVWEQYLALNIASRGQPWALSMHLTGIKAESPALAVFSYVPGCWALWPFLSSTPAFLEDQKLPA